MEEIISDLWYNRSQSKIMDAIGQLRDEHRGVKLMLDVMERVAGKLASGERVDPEHLDQVLEFLQVFVGRCHHAKEEEILFPELNEKAEIEGLLKDHHLGHSFIENLALEIAQYKINNQSAPTEIAKTGLSYVELMRGHIEREELLFNVAEEEIGPEKDKEIFEEFEGIEKERIGLGKHEEFHMILEELKRVYLS